MQKKKPLNIASFEPASWLWTKWLQPQISYGQKYKRFIHYEFIEDETKRQEVEDDLAKLLYEYHTTSPININLLTELKYPQLASTFAKNSDQRPHNSKTRTGNLVEILACEFAKTQEYDIPIMRLRYNPNPDQSMKGDDILGFNFSGDPYNKQDAFLIGEGKFRAKFETKAIEEAYNNLKEKTRLYPVSMEFAATILALKGDQIKATQIRQLRQKIASKNRNIFHASMVFIGTVGQPQNPFEFLENYPDHLLPNLIAVNIVFKDNFRDWIERVYKKECWN